VSSTSHGVTLLVDSGASCCTWAVLESATVVDGHVDQGSGAVVGKHSLPGCGHGDDAGQGVSTLCQDAEGGRAMMEGAIVTGLEASGSAMTDGASYDCALSRDTLEFFPEQEEDAYAEVGWGAIGFAVHGVVALVGGSSIGVLEEGGVMWNWAAIGR